MKLYLDDIRNPILEEGWTVIRTAEEALLLLEIATVEEISLDHDLGIFTQPMRVPMTK